MRKNVRRQIFDSVFLFGGAHSHAEPGLVQSQIHKMSKQTDISPVPASVSPASRDREPVAAWWHTFVFVAIIVGMGALSALNRAQSRMPSRMVLYMATIIYELVLLGYVWLLGLRPARKRVRDLIGGKWACAADFWRDVGIAIIFWIIVAIVLMGVGQLLGRNSTGLETVKDIAPQGAAQMIAWVALCLTAGFVEEVVFRGYLQRQFFALTGTGTCAVALQALVFGSAHLYEGLKSAIAITVYAALFGILAIKAKSLRPGMMQHAGQDLLVGIAAGILRHFKRI